MHSGQGNRTFPQGSFHTSEVYSQLLVTSFQRSGSQLDGETCRTHNEEEARAAWGPSWTQGAPEAKVPRWQPQVFALSRVAGLFFLHTSSCELVQTALIFGHCAYFPEYSTAFKKG